MNKPAWLFGGSTFLLGGTCLYLLLQLRDEASAGAPPTQSQAALQMQLGQVQAERDRLETVVQSMRTAKAAPQSALQPMAAAPAAPSAVPPIVNVGQPELSFEVRRKMARLRSGKLISQLGLTQTQVDSLLDVLAAQGERAAAAIKPGMPLPNMEELRARDRREVEAIIGRESAEKLDVWQQQASLRMQLRHVRDQLEDVGEPMTEAQLSRIQELVRAHPPPTPPIRQQDEPLEDFRERFKSWRTENRDAMRAEVSTVLEPRQLARYDEIDEVAREFDKVVPVMAPPALATAGRAAPPVR